VADQLDLGLDATPRRARTAVLRAAHIRSHVPVAAAESIEEKAAKQEDLVLAWFRAHPGHRAGPSEVWVAMGGQAKGWPLTSVRARITTLERRGLLTHWPADRRPGAYGSMESSWSLA
jgi:hypothetical protein